MKNLSLRLSQRAHKRLVAKHKRIADSNPKKYDKHFTLMNYHSVCFARQSSLGRKLSFAERAKLYDYTVKTFY